jgi:hypothetical protein
MMRSGRAALPWVAGFAAGIAGVVLALPPTAEEVATTDPARSAQPDQRDPARGFLGPGDHALDAVPTAEQDPGAAMAADGTPGASEPRQGAPTGRRAGTTAAAAPTGGSLRIGVGLPDIGAIAALGPGYDQGDPRAHVESALAQLRQEGRLPVHGQDIEPVYRTYDIISAESQRAACEGFALDDAVFAVVAISNFGVGYECVTRDHGIPLLTSNGVLDELYASTPNMLSLQMSLDRHLRNFVEWAHRRGDLTGKRIGLYYSTDPVEARSARQSVIGPLRDLGHAVAVEVQTSEPATGGPTDSVAVQRFRSSGVDVAILLVSPIAKTNFMAQAELQRYRPRYLENDLASSTTTTATSTYPAQHFDGTRGFTGLRFGELASGMPMPAPARWCLDAIAHHGGRSIDPRTTEAEHIAANRACDALTVLVDALQAAGPDPDRDRLLEAVATLERREMGIHGDVGFEPGRQHGTETWRELVWRAGCRCWVAEGPFRSLLVR